MKEARKIAEQEILTFVDELDPTGTNSKIYRQIFAGMDDKYFVEFMTKLDNDTDSLPIFAFSFENDNMTVERNLALAKKYDIPIFEKLKISGQPGVPDHITHQEFMLCDIQCKRQSQNIDHKTSVPKNNRTIDQLTYQPTGASKGSKLSLPEARVLNALGLNNCIEEWWRYRGGDKGGFRAMNQMAEQTGAISLAAIAPYATGVESVHALKEFMFARLIEFED